MKTLLKVIAILVALAILGIGFPMVVSWTVIGTLAGVIFVIFGIIAAISLWRGHLGWGIVSGAVLLLLACTAASYTTVGLRNISANQWNPFAVAANAQNPWNQNPDEVVTVDHCVGNLNDNYGNGTSYDVERGHDDLFIAGTTTWRVTCDAAGHVTTQNLTDGDSKKQESASDGPEDVTCHSADGRFSGNPGMGYSADGKNWLCQEDGTLREIFFDGTTTDPETRTDTTCAAPAASYDEFDPMSNWDWEELRSMQTPTFDEFLTAHGLTREDIQDFTPMTVSWEPTMFVVELTPDNYGKSVPLIEGFEYTVALSDDSVETFWGGDESIQTACLKWGMTARWVPSYTTNSSNWLNPDDGRELVAREYRFGRNLRGEDMVDVRRDVPYFSRLGPYYTGSGNIDTRGWNPPSLDQNVPANFMDACSILGGLCRENEWTFGERASGGYLNWHWEYTDKVAGSGTYCPAGDPCWQTVYPPEGPGYIEVWLSAGTTGPDGKPVNQAGAYKFYAADRPILVDGMHNVDSFTYHADPSR